MSGEDLSRGWTGELTTTLTYKNGDINITPTSATGNRWSNQSMTMMSYIRSIEVVSFKLL